MTPISLSRLHFPVTALGPGRRIGIWFQGCSIHCDGCISVDTWPFVKPSMTVDGVLAFLVDWLASSDGFTISGGEPFDQPDALLALLTGLRGCQKPGADILVYSGYPIERLDDTLQAWSGLIDVLVSDPFIVNQTDALALRGSDNQRVSLLTPLARQRADQYDRYRRLGDERIDLMADDDGTFWLAGIPRRGDMTRLQNLLAARGTNIDTSEHPFQYQQFLHTPNPESAR